MSCIGVLPTGSENLDLDSQSQPILAATRDLIDECLAAVATIPPTVAPTTTPEPPTSAAGTGSTEPSEGATGTGPSDATTGVTEPDANTETSTNAATTLGTAAPILLLATALFSLI